MNTSTETSSHPAPPVTLAVEPIAGTDRGQITLPEGRVIVYRPIEPSDQEALQRFHRRLSDQTVFFRFFGPLRELSTARAVYFTNVDGYNRFALVALDPDQPGDLIAVARIDREPGTNRAEYAAVVVDEWQGRGLGFALTKCLIDAARARGIKCFYAIVLPENLRMLNLLRDLGLPRRVRWADGAERIEVDITAPLDPAGVTIENKPSTGADQ
ncbi:MAG TPA: GNAT family N-acetyltransferase [Thermomicrobiales bacterium]|jgi:RimJ/RimL family protein N-acetyltransferase|nr:GNAT family N-acetyltransferase [Thermomicrobiales bacterium]